MDKNIIDTYLCKLSSNDKVIASLIDTYPKYASQVSFNPFHDLIRSIISQQLSVKAAETIYGRYINLMGKNYNADRLISIDIEALRAVGMSYQKCNYIKNVAFKVVENTDFFSLLKSSSDKEVIIELTKIKGVGVWTAQMFLMFTLGRLDVLPLGDVGIQNAVQKFYGLETKPDETKLRKISKKWKPYRTISCWYLWQGLDA